MGTRLGHNFKSFLLERNLMRIQSSKTLTREPAGVKFGARPMTIKTNLHDKFYEEKSRILTFQKKFIRKRLVHKNI